MARNMSLDNPSHLKAVNMYMLGHPKTTACKMAGLSPLYAKELFARPDVKGEIERRLKVTEQKNIMDREWLLDKLKMIIEATPGDLIEVDAKGRPSMDFSKLPTNLRKSITKITVDTSRDGGKYKKQKSHVSIQIPDKIAAIKEAAVLLGLREEKHKVDMETSLIDELTKRRHQLAGEDDGENG
jgi:phage terminase small subunit